MKYGESHFFEDLFTLVLTILINLPKVEILLNPPKTDGFDLGAFISSHHQRILNELSTVVWHNKNLVSLFTDLLDLDQILNYKDANGKTFLWLIVLYSNTSQALKCLRKLLSEDQSREKLTQVLNSYILKRDSGGLNLIDYCFIKRKSGVAQYIKEFINDLNKNQTNPGGTELTQNVNLPSLVKIHTTGWPKSKSVIRAEMEEIALSHSFCSIYGKPQKQDKNMKNHKRKSLNAEYEYFFKNYSKLGFKNELVDGFDVLAPYQVTSEDGTRMRGLTKSISEYDKSQFFHAFQFREDFEVHIIDTLKDLKGALDCLSSERILFFDVEFCSVQSQKLHPDARVLYYLEENDEYPEPLTPEDEEESSKKTAEFVTQINSKKSHTLFLGVRYLAASIQISTMEKAYWIDSIKLHDHLTQLELSKPKEIESGTGKINQDPEGLDPLEDNYSTNRIFSKILTDRKVIKVFHSCEGDVNVIYRSFGIIVNNIFDTARTFQLILNELKNSKEEKISTLFKDLRLDPKTNYGLKDLASILIGVKLDKSFQTAMWRVRPVPKVMLEYAVNDAVILGGITQKLFELLELADFEDSGGFSGDKKQGWLAVRQYFVEKFGSQQKNKDEKQENADSGDDQTLGNMTYKATFSNEFLARLFARSNQVAKWVDRVDYNVGYRVQT